MINIDELIKNAMKSRNQVELRTYKGLKAKMQEFKTAKNAKPYDEAAELSIIKKLAAQHKDSIEQYKAANRLDLVEGEAAELEVLQKLLPPEVNVTDITAALGDWLLHEKGYMFIPKSEMGQAIKYLKEKFPSADGRTVADIVKSRVK